MQKLINDHEEAEASRVRGIISSEFSRACILNAVHSRYVENEMAAKVNAFEVSLERANVRTQSLNKRLKDKEKELRRAQADYVSSQDDLSLQTQKVRGLSESLRASNDQLKQRDVELAAKGEEIERMRQDSRALSERFASWTKDLGRLAEGRDRKIGKIASKIQKSMASIATNAARLSDSPSNLSSTTVNSENELDQHNALTVAALEEEISGWKQKCKELTLRLERVSEASKQKEKRLERRASVKLLAAESSRKQAEDMLRAQIEGENSECRSK